jgi:hypothetical protein
MHHAIHTSIDQCNLAACRSLKVRFALTVYLAGCDLKQAKPCQNESQQGSTKSNSNASALSFVENMANFFQLKQLSGRHGASAPVAMLTTDLKI